MKKLLTVLLLALGTAASAQINRVSLQASGLTCSLCSKAVLSALQEVPFVEKVQVDIKNQQYNLTFKTAAAVELDRLNQAVRDAGFSVASMAVDATVPAVLVKKDQHLQIGGQTFHVLNAGNQTLSGEVRLAVVDKGFVTEKEYRKHAALTKLACVKTGRAATCCAIGDAASERIYHVVI